MLKLRINHKTAIAIDLLSGKRSKFQEVIPLRCIKLVGLQAKKKPNGRPRDVCRRSHGVAPAAAGCRPRRPPGGRTVPAPPAAAAAPPPPAARRTPRTAPRSPRSAPPGWLLPRGGGSGQRASMGGGGSYEPCRVLAITAARVRVPTGEPQCTPLQRTTSNCNANARQRLRRGSGDGTGPNGVRVWLSTEATVKRGVSGQILLSNPGPDAHQ